MRGLIPVHHALRITKLLCMNRNKPKYKSIYYNRKLFLCICEKNIALLPYCYHSVLLLPAIF